MKGINRDTLSTTLICAGFLGHVASRLWLANDTLAFAAITTLWLGLLAGINFHQESPRQRMLRYIGALGACLCWALCLYNYIMAGQG